MKPSSFRPRNFLRLTHLLPSFQYCHQIAHIPAPAHHYLQWRQDLTGVEATTLPLSLLEAFCGLCRRTPLALISFTIIASSNSTVHHTGWYSPLSSALPLAHSRLHHQWTPCQRCVCAQQCKYGNLNTQMQQHLTIGQVALDREIAGYCFAHVVLIGSR
jgi:hypothetical protein